MGILTLPISNFCKIPSSFPPTDSGKPNPPCEPPNKELDLLFGTISSGKNSSLIIC